MNIQQRRCIQGRCCAHGDEVRAIQDAEIESVQLDRGGLVAIYDYERTHITITDERGRVQQFVVMGDVRVVARR